MSSVENTLTHESLQIFTVEQATRTFLNIQKMGTPLSAWANRHIPGRRYTSHIFNWLGFDNHFQGMARLQNSHYLLVSGGDPHTPMSHLFVIKMASCDQTGRMNSNLDKKGKPSKNDRIVKALNIDNTMWHAGGIGVMGDIVSVPIYSARPKFVNRRQKWAVNSKVVFYTFRDPENPVRLPFEVSIPGGKAYATALTQLDDGHFLLAVWRNNNKKESGRSDKRRLDLYVSRAKTFDDGFEQRTTTWFQSEVQAVQSLKPEFRDYQSISCVRQNDGKLFLIGTHNSGKWTPTFSRHNEADLFQVDLPATQQLKTGGISNPGVRITRVASKRFSSKLFDFRYNMDAAACTYIDAAGRLFIYSAYHWLRKGRVNFMEFGALT